GGDLLPWLAKHGYPIYCYEIGKMGDLGNIPSYLETMNDVLHGRFPSMSELMPRMSLGSELYNIERESLEMADPITHLTLGEKIEKGLVNIKAPVRIGKYVRVFPGVTISDANIDDDCEIFENATIIRSSIGAGSMIGPFSVIEDTLTGTMVELQSSEKAPVILRRFVAIGDEVVIRGGVELDDSITIFPRLKVPAGIKVPANTDIESADKMLEYL
ncbi:MAG: hypothetical protein WCJ56_14075, partial [bacterium]